MLSIASNALLTLGKIAVGISIGSVAVLSEALHSGVDLLASFIALFAVKTAGIPADEGHKYGHGKIENISGSIEALLIFFAAGWIIFESIKKLSSPEPMHGAFWGFAIMLVSVALNTFVSQKLFKVGTETDSLALLADAWHLRVDIFTSAGVMIAMLAIWLGSKMLTQTNLLWIDPVVAILVAIFIIKAAYNLTKEAIGGLLDTALPEAEEALIKDSIVRYYPQISGYHQLRTRKAGDSRFLEFHIQVRETMSVTEAHHIGKKISSDIKGLLANTNITVHAEPCDGKCTKRCLCGCLLSAEERKMRFGDSP